MFPFHLYAHMSKLYGFQCCICCRPSIVFPTLQLVFITTMLRDLKLKFSLNTVILSACRYLQTRIKLSFFLSLILFSICINELDLLMNNPRKMKLCYIGCTCPLMNAASTGDVPHTS